MRILGKKGYANNVVWVAAFVGCGVFAFSMLLGVLFGLSGTTTMRSELENGYKRAFFEMADSVENIEVVLSEILVSSNEQHIVELASQVAREAQVAIGCLNQLPISDQTAHDVHKFFNQVDDFCTSYALAVLNMGETSDFEDKIEELFVLTCNVNAQIQDIATDFGGADYSVLRSLARKGVRTSGDFCNSTDKLSSRAMEYPELVYDGKLSDGGQRCFRALENLSEVDKEQAADILKQIFEDRITDLKCFAETQEPDAYEFVAKMEGGTAYYSVSKKGGKLLSLNTDLESNSAQLDEEQARFLALRHAQKSGYTCKLDVVSYKDVDNVAYVELAPVCQGVVLYPDLIKIEVGLDNGRLIALDANGYCQNNCTRELTPRISKEAAKSAASAKLDITQIRLALINANCTERLCYELTASYKQMNYKIYIDALTARQLQVTWLK